jgi:hypothetical protein
MSGVKRCRRRTLRHYGNGDCGEAPGGAEVDGLIAFADLVAAEFLAVLCARRWYAARRSTNTEGRQLDRVTPPGFGNPKYRNRKWCGISAAAVRAPAAAQTARLRPAGRSVEGRTP